MKKLSKIRNGVALLSAATCLTGFHGCFGSEEEEEASPTVEIISPVNGSKITGPHVLVQVKVTDFELGGGAAKTSAAQHEGGHVHIFLDKPKGLDADAAATMTNSDTLTLTNVTAGAHYLIVQGATKTHRDYEGMKDSVAFLVE